MLRSQPSALSGNQAFSRGPLRQVLNRGMHNDADIGRCVSQQVCFQLVRHGLERLLRDVQGARFHRPQDRPQSRFSGRLALGLDVEE
jgi:hypothetical protein